jgi:hypothetical protein
MPDKQVMAELKDRKENFFAYEETKHQLIE